MSADYTNSLTALLATSKVNAPYRQSTDPEGVISHRESHVSIFSQPEMLVSLVLDRSERLRV